MNIVCVVVPIYKSALSEAEFLSIKMTVKNLTNYEVCVICPRRLIEFVRLVSREINYDLKVVCFEDRYFESVDGYNQLLLNAEFYSAFEKFKFILIVQTDALVLSESLADFIDSDFSYIGAPWFNGMHVPNLPYKFLGVGNGGLSLRRVDHALKVLQKNGSYRLPKELYPSRGVLFYLKVFFKIIKYRFAASPSELNLNEDVFWGFVAPNSFDFYKVASPEFALKFAFEVAPRYLYKLNNFRLPFGCHAWERYDSEFWLQHAEIKSLLSSSREIKCDFT